MLTTRMKKAMTLILKAEGYITLKEIAKIVGVSTRTLLRESDSLEQWTVTNGGQFIKKKGSGIKVAGDEGERKRLLKCLQESASDIIFSPDQRSIIIRSELLKSDEPLKLYAIATVLDVVESTISGDLLSVNNWFEGYGISVIRRQGLGILLKGDEKAKRKAIVSLLYDQVTFSDFMNFIRLDQEQDSQNFDDIRNKINKSLFGLLDIEHLKVVALMVEDIGREMGFSYADTAFMVLCHRICVTLKRQPYWGQQLLDYEYREVLRKDRVYVALRSWINSNHDSLIETMPEEELLYLTMHMKGSKIRETKNDSHISMNEDFRTIQLAKEFVLAVEKETGIYLSDNEALIFGLVKHLRPAIYRMKMEIDFINPLMMEIKTMYPKLFLAIRKCVSIIETREKVLVTDDEVAYLATHIGAVIQKTDREIIKKFQVVLACMYGIGASQLLVANIEKNFKNIDIVDVISVMDYKMNRVNFDLVDLVISTMPMETGETPCIVVNPVFRQEDVIEISEFLKNYIPKKRIGRNTGALNLKDKLIKLADYNRIILALIDDFEFDQDIPVKNMASVIEYASGSIAKSQDEKHLLAEAFEEREEKGSTILSKKGMMLLHCRANVAGYASLKIFQLRGPIVVDHLGEGLPINTIVVMVGPAVINQKVLNVLSEISRCIITSSFAEIIMSGEQYRVESELHRILDNYYQKLTSTL